MLSFHSWAWARGFSMVFFNLCTLMRTLYFSFLLISLVCTFAKAQKFKRPYQDERKGYLEIGVGAVAAKAGAPYIVTPDFLKNTRLSYQFFVAPQFLISPRINLGIRLGGLFRPKFYDQDITSQIQGKLTPYALPFLDFYLGNANRDRSARFFFGVAGGATYFGTLDARNTLTDETYRLRRENRNIFLTIAPHVGFVFGDLKIQVEHMITMPAQPAITSLTLSNIFPMGRRRYF